MAKSSKNTPEDQEIDLAVISKKIGTFSNRVATSIFKAILFFKRNLLLLAILFVVGVVVGYFIDKSTKLYDHEIIVTTNFGSSEYLYSKMELLSSKIKESDTVFLQSLGLLNFKNITLIKVEPILDIYDFVNDDDPNNLNYGQKTTNLELVKLLAEDSDINKVIKEDLTSKKYKRHTIHIITKGKTKATETVQPILTYLNDNNHYEKIKNQNIENIQFKLQQNETIIAQIDSFLSGFSTTVSNAKSEKLIYYNENSPLNAVIKTKDDLLKEQNFLKIKLLNINQTIKENSTIINKKHKESATGKLKFLLPLFFIFAFIFLSLFQSFYRKQTLQLKQTYKNN